jgi:galactokinase
VARVVAPADRAALEERTRRGFAARFGPGSELCVSAPGRANLIGEHTDYNEGFVLPFAVARRTAVAARARGDRRVVVESALARGRVEIDLDAPIVPGEPRWGDYVRGVVAECLTLASDDGPVDVRGFEAWIDSDVPVGAGLSSSAALEVAVTGVIESLAGRRIDPAAKAALCRRAEQKFAGVPCGIMDQMASVLAGEDSLLFLDCRDVTWTRVALPAGEVELVVVDSELPHDLGEGEFARRVQQCQSAARLLAVPSLREASREDVERLASEPVLYRRARHVVEENERVLEAVGAIQTNDWERLGALLDASHASLRELYEVSRPEMDTLVGDLRRAGAVGARMTGGGFGGCAVALFRTGTFSADTLSADRTPRD